MGWILDALHLSGGSWSIALLFRKLATHAMPVSPMCFKICNGIELIPELLFALKACCSVLLSSAGVMCCACADSTGVYYSGGMEGS